MQKTHTRLHTRNTPLTVLLLRASMHRANVGQYFREDKAVMDSEHRLCHVVLTCGVVSLIVLIPIPQSNAFLSNYQCLGHLHIHGSEVHISHTPVKSPRAQCRPATRQRQWTSPNNRAKGALSKLSLW